MRRAAVLVLLASAVPALAQWSSDPGANLQVADRSGEQNQPKLVPTADGGCYISWYDNSTGGYDVYLNRLDANGVELWGHNGILIADRGVSSTVDYSLTKDADGNAIIAYNDDSATPGGQQQISVQKVSPAGVKLWGPSGVTLTSGSGSRNNPRIAVLTTGDVAVGWTESGWQLRRLTSAGAPTGTPMNVIETGHTIFLCDLQPGDNGSVIASWTRSFGTNYAITSRWVFAQKYDGSNAPLWPNTPSLPAVGVYATPPSSPWPTGSGTYGTQGGSVQNGYFPAFAPDGNGGAIFAIYENGGPRNAYVQHVLPDGTLRFPQPGISNALTATNRIRVSSAAVYDRTADAYYVASVESDASPQANYRTFVQRISASGLREFGPTGVTLVSGTGFQQSWVVPLLRSDGGVSVFGFDGRNAASSVMVGWGAGVSSEGTPDWNNFFSTTIEAKTRMVGITSTRGFHILAFGSGATAEANIAAQHVLFDGTFGPVPPACNPDVNQDGNSDQGDVDYLINVVAGGDNPTGVDPDFNHDGNPDQGDVDALINVIAGGDCP